MPVGGFVPPSAREVVVLVIMLFLVIGVPVGLLIWALIRLL